MQSKHSGLGGLLLTITFCFTIFNNAFNLTIFCVDQVMLLHSKSLNEETCLMQGGHEGGFDQHGISKEVRYKRDMASGWQCPRVNDHQVVQAKMEITIGAQNSSISTAPFLLTFQTLLQSFTHIPNIT